MGSSLVYDPATHDTEIVHAQFNRLIAELLKGAINRNTFQPWEIEVLLDIQSCDIGDISEKDILKRYQKAVQRSYERGAKMPLKLSEYMATLKSRRIALAEQRAEFGRTEFGQSQIAS